MTLTDKIAALRTAGFRIGYADPRTAYATGLGWQDVTDYPFDGGMPVAVLNGIARGEDRADQSTTVDRSNFRSLLRDYGQAIVTVSHSNVDVLALFPHSASPRLINTVMELSTDYPLYDESDLSELETDEITESFDAYLWADFQDDISPEAQDIAELFTTGDIRDAFHQAMSDADYCPEHTGLDVRWDDATVIELLEVALFALAGTLAPAPASASLF